MKLNAIGINIYGGGFTLGVQKRFKVLGQWEEITLGRDTFDLNFGTTVPRPLCDWSDWPVKEYEGEVPLVYANPPCAPWSSANTRAGYTKDKRFLDARLALTKHTMDTALKLRPQIFISESVENAYNIGVRHYDQYVKRWMRAGYSVTFFLTDAVLHGLASTRRRFHFIAHKYAIDFDYFHPYMNHFKPTTVRDMIWDIRNKIGKIAQHDIPSSQQSRRAGFVSPIIIMRNTPKGGRARETERTWPKYKGPYSSFLVKRIMWDAPAFTMVGLSKLIHPDGERLLTWREGLRLMSFPDSFTAAREIEAADSVTPLMGEFLSKIALQCIKDAMPMKEIRHSVVDWRHLGKPFRICEMKKQIGKGGLS